MSVKLLKNPKTPTYSALKKEVLSSNFSWHWVNESTLNHKDETNHKNHPYFSHCVLRRPNDVNDDSQTLFPRVTSNYFDGCNRVLKEIFDENNINCNCVLRINFNLTLPLSNIPTIPHYDHEFEHKNLISFFTESGGATVCENESYDHKEDDIILFSGLHYMHLPQKDRRVIMITTFI